MALSDVNYCNVLLFIRRGEVVCTKDIDSLLADIAENKESIKSLLKAKNALMQHIYALMRQRAQKRAALSCSQMLDYREFSEFYAAESAVLSSYMARLKGQMSHSRLSREILEPQADLAAIYRGLGVIVTLQKRIIAVLQGMVSMAGQILSVLGPAGANLSFA